MLTGLHCSNFGHHSRVPHLHHAVSVAGGHLEESGIIPDDEIGRDSNPSNRLHPIHLKGLGYVRVDIGGFLQGKCITARYRSIYRLQWSIFHAW